MKRAKIDRRIFVETEREGLLGPWVIHTLRKSKRALRIKRRTENVRF